MAINGSVLKTGATGMTVVGGADITFIENGVSIPNGISVADSAATDLRIQKSIVASRRAPVYDQTTKTWSKEKISVTVRKPKLLADGSMSFDLIRIQREAHPENSSAEKLELNLLAAQVLADADYIPLFTAGSIS